MDDAPVVSRGEGVDKGAGNVDDASEGQPVFRNEAVERLALDELHGQEVDAFMLFHGVERDDMRVVEGSVQRGPRAGNVREPARPSTSLGTTLRPSIGQDTRVTSAGRTLSATSRPSLVSVARYASPCRPPRAEPPRRSDQGDCRVRDSSLPGRSQVVGTDRGGDARVCDRLENHGLRADSTRPRGRRAPDQTVTLLHPATRTGSPKTQEAAG